MAGTYLPLPVVLVRNRFETARRILGKNASSVSEVDLIRLSALQAQVTYGKFQPTREIPELRHKSLVFRKRQREEWKALGALSRQRAMEQFLDLMQQLLPNWDKDLEFGDLEITPSGSVPESQLASLDLSKSPFHDVGTQSSLVKPPRITHSSTARPAAVSLPHSRSKGALEELQMYDFKRIVTSLPKLSRLDAGYDAAETIRKIQLRNITAGEEGKRPLESRYYRRMKKEEEPGEPPAEQVKAVLGGFLETLQSGINFGGENALWSDKAKDAVNRLEMTFSSLSKAASTPANPTFSTPTDQVATLFRPKFAAVESALFECQKLMNESSQPCATFLQLIRQDFAQAVTTLLDYIDEINEDREERVRELRKLQQTHEEEHKIVKCLRELYYASDPKYELKLITKQQASKLELALAEGYSHLEEGCRKDLKSMEDNLQVALSVIDEVYSRFVFARNERDKLQDEIAMVQMSAYQENILLSNIYKDLKKSVGIIQGSEGRGLPNEVQLKKEVDELKSELLVLRKDNEGMRERLRDARRRNSIIVMEGT